MQSSPKSSNCTFMELKSRNIFKTNKLFIVLIVPLWNWNTVDKGHWCDGADGSNCTFMELKLRNVVKEEVCKAGSNCTFMELKY